MMFPSREQVKAVKKAYPIGCKVRLVLMNDPQAPPTGTIGRVIAVDDAATVHVAWSTGSTLGIVLEEDKCERI